jgi:hypothetical protein
MAILTRLLQSAAKQGLEAFAESRRPAADKPDRPTVKQIKADMRNVSDWHHRQHHGDWLTVVEVETRVGTRYRCLCPKGFTVWADAENVIKTRRVPQPPTRPQGDPTACEKGL